jgi:hypothetical protein
VTGGETIENAHDALADVEATVVVYSWLIQFYGHDKGVQPFCRPELAVNSPTVTTPELQSTLPIVTPELKAASPSIEAAARFSRQFYETAPAATISVVPAAYGGDGPGPAPELPQDSNSMPKHKTIGKYHADQLQLPL